MTNNFAGAVLDSAAGKEAYDAACKRLLAVKEISAFILKYTAKEYEGLSIDEIVKLIGPADIGTSPVDADSPSLIRLENSKDTTITEGSREFDVKFSARTPEIKIRLIYCIFNIEAQKDFSPGYSLIKRGLYYCARLISAQYGTVFEGSDYDKLQKVYSIWICTSPDKAHKNTITRYSISSEAMFGSVDAAAAAQDKADSDLLELIMVCLGDDDDETSSNELINMLNVLFSSRIDSTEKKKRLEKYGIHMTREINMEVENMCNLGQGVYENGKAEGISIGRTEGIKIGQARGIDIGRTEGIKIGQARGIDIGRTEGISIGRLNAHIDLARKYMEMGHSFAESVDFVSSSPSEAKEVSEALKKLLS